MSAQPIKRASAGRFTRAYYLAWGLGATAGLAYLGSVASQLEFRSSPPPPPQVVVDPEAGLRVAGQALTEVGSVRRSVIEVRNDLGRLKETVDQREAGDKETQARIAALEEKVTTLATPPPIAAAPEPSPNHRSVERSKAAAEKKVADRRATARVVTVVEGASPAPPPAPEEPARVETGSIAPAPPAVTFGQAEVTQARQQVYSVQVAAGPSLDALRLTWSLLVERHGALAILKPRFVAPKAGSGAYRLVAGPLSSKADAERVCADMGVGRQGCLPTTAVGEPL